MFTRITATLLILALSACGGSSTGSEFASLYTGDESGSWYSFSNNCSAQLCPPN